MKSKKSEDTVKETDTKDKGPKRNKKKEKERVEENSQEKC